jgi:hypothetical protein
MLDIVKLSHSGNRSGQTVSGRGLARRKLSHEQRIGLAADLVCGCQHLDPSCAQAAALLGVTVVQTRDELKARSAVADDASAARWLAQLEAEAANEQADDIVQAWSRGSLTARDAATRILGPAEVWDVLARVIV